MYRAIGYDINYIMLPNRVTILLEVVRKTFKALLV